MTEATTMTSTNGGSAPKKKARKKRPQSKLGRPDLLGRFGPYLMLRRKKENLSIRAFAKKAGVAHTNIFQYERLRKDPRLTELALLASALREPLSKFLEPLL